MLFALASTLFLSASAMAPVPPELVIKPDEQVVLDQGKVVVRVPGGHRPTMAIVDVKATPDAAMAAVLDLRVRVNEIGGLKSVEVYEESEGALGAKWTMGVAVFSAVFHIRYEYDKSAGWCTYDLDPRYPNELNKSRGSYHVYAVPTGSRIVYRSSSAIDGAPDWIKKRLAQSSAREMLTGMKTRAER